MSRDVKNLTQRKQLAALLLSRDVKLKKKEVAALVGVVPETISRWLQEQAFQNLIEREAQKELDDVRSLLNKADFFAALKEMELLACGNENVEARVAADILDRTGYAKPKEIDLKVMQVNPLEGATIDQIYEIAEASRALEGLTEESRQWLLSPSPDEDITGGDGEDPAAD